MFLAMQQILQIHRPQLVFLSETKLQSMQMDTIRSKLNFDSCFAVDSSGRGRGLAMLWNFEICVHIKSFSKHHIDAEQQMGNEKQMRCTEVYGHPEMQQKKHTWTLLRRLLGLSSTP